jgi:hypothetical protein
MTCIKLEDVLLQEAKAIHPDKKPVIGSYEELLRLESTALCISGGGIRSASFSQGVIEALACHPRPDAANPHPERTVGSAQDSLLAQFHYLSTVSGGGYVGSWLSAWVTREHRPGGAGWAGVWTKLTGKRAKPDREAPEIHWLRTYSNYLTPKLGLTSADTWAGIAIFLRNLILNWFVLLPVLAAILLVLKLFAIALGWTSVFPADVELRQWPSEPQQWIFWILVLLGLLALLTALYFSNRHRPTHGPRNATQGQFLKFDLLPGFLAALLLTCAIAVPGVQALAQDYLLASVRLPDPQNALIIRPSLYGIIALAVFGTALCALSWILAWPRNASRLGPDFVSWSIAGLVFGALVAVGIYLYFSSPAKPIWPFKTKEILLLTIGVPWGILSGLVAEMIFVGLTKDVPGSDSDREWLGRAAGWYLLVALAWPIAMTLVFLGSIVAKALYAEVTAWITAGGAGAITALLGKSSATAAKSDKATWKSVSLNVILAIAAIVFAVALVVGMSAVLDHILLGKPLVEVLPERVVQAGLPEWPGGWKVPAALVLILIVGWVASWRVNINRFSLHALYRNRIIRGFLGASNTNRNPDPFTGFDENDNLRVHELWQEGVKVGPSNWRPFHVVNMALNLAKGEDLAWQERKAESFTASPLHSGSSRLGYRDSKHYGDGDGISLGTAVAISGAAASPNMGYHSSPPLALLLTLLNVRLGWWLGNPGKAGEETYTRSSPPFAIKPLLFELFGQTTDSADYVYLSDGGHFENLALYEMVRRRCRHIVVIDAGCDKEFAFADLGNAVRKIWIDFGIAISFSTLKALTFREDKGVTYKTDEPPFYAVGIIHYPEATNDEEHGVILYIKPCYLGGRITNAGVRNYATANVDFPHQSTGDQWFSESQLESYRALGFEMMDSVLNEIGASANCPPNPKLPDIFAALTAMSAVARAAPAPQHAGHGTRPPNTGADVGTR